MNICDNRLWSLHLERTWFPTWECAGAQCITNYCKFYCAYHARWFEWEEDSANQHCDNSSGGFPSRPLGREVLLNGRNWCHNLCKVAEEEGSKVDCSGKRNTRGIFVRMAWPCEGFHPRHEHHQVHEWCHWRILTTKLTLFTYDLIIHRGEP